MRLFDKQVARKPDLYPWTHEYIKAMWAGFWTPNEFSFTSDKHDFKTQLTDQENQIVVRTLSAISQIEIAVKKFWARLGDNLQHPSINDMGLVMAHVECYSDDTEILTPSGWKFIKDINIGDIVYQYNYDSMLEETKVLHTVNKKYNGQMYSFGSKSNNCLVTPNHQMLIQRKKRSGWKVEKVLAKDLRFHSSIKLPWTVIYNKGTVNHLTALDRIKIAIQADGTLGMQYNRDGSKVPKGNNGGFTHAFRFSKKRKISRLKKILKDANIDFSETLIANGNTQILVKLEVGKNYKDFTSWIDLSDKTSNWCKEFIEELVNWDGNCINYYFSKDKKQVDFCQHVGILAGYHSTVGFTPDFRNKKGQTKYRVSFNKKKNLWRHIIGMHNSLEDYNGSVVCVSVSSGAIVTRRNGKTFIAGNCIHNLAYEKLLTVLGLTDEFQKNLEVPVIQNRVKYLTKYLDKVYKDEKKQYVYALILFTLFVENISLFSQFYIILWFGRFKNVLKDTNQQVHYTTREERLHAEIGIHLIKVLKVEYSELFDEELYARIINEAKEAYKAEAKIIDWLLGDYQNERISADILKSFVQLRINESLGKIGLQDIYAVNSNHMRDFEWMYEEVLGNVMTDFFFRKPVEYSKKNRVISDEELF